MRNVAVNRCEALVCEESSSFREVSETVKKPEMRGAGRGGGGSCAKRGRVYAFIPEARRRHGEEATRVASTTVGIDRRAWRSIERDRNVRSIKACLACLNARCTRRSLLLGLIRSDVRRPESLVSPKPAEERHSKTSGTFRPLSGCPTAALNDTSIYSPADDGRGARAARERIHLNRLGLSSVGVSRWEIEEGRGKGGGREEKKEDCLAKPFEILRRLSCVRSRQIAVYDQGYCYNRTVFPDHL